MHRSTRGNYSTATAHIPRISFHGFGTVNKWQGTVPHTCRYRRLTRQKAHAEGLWHLLVQRLGYTVQTACSLSDAQLCAHMCEHTNNPIQMMTGRRNDTYRWHSAGGTVPALSENLLVAAEDWLIAVLPFRGHSHLTKRYERRQPTGVGAA